VSSIYTQRCVERCPLKLQGPRFDVASSARRSYEAQASTPTPGTGTKLHIVVFGVNRVSGDATKWWSLVLQGDGNDAAIGEASMLPVVVTIPIFVP
jgi:hypothetical protein